MKILILGGTLFIGYYTVKELLASNQHDIALFNRGNRKEEIPDEVKLIMGNRKNLNQFVDEFKDFSPDVVLNMVPIGDEDTKLFMETFQGITQRVVGISSCDVYRAYDKMIENEAGEPEEMPLREDSPLRTNFYPYRDKTENETMKKYDKILAERNIMSDSNMPGTILRFPMIYGPRDYQHRLYSYIKRMDDNRPFILINEKQADWRMSRGYVEDMAHAVCLAITTEDAAGKIYNVAEIKSYTEENWIQKIGEIIGWNGEVVRVPESEMPLNSFNTDQDLLIDSSRIRGELGYEETIEQDEALERTIEWERANPPQNIDDHSFDYQKEDELYEKISA